ncbi:MAG: hypothetical protein CK424_06095 [Legionella sp.]|nr:MAG: hypothetical protein CK424_06095 [Legionella sp.]
MIEENDDLMSASAVIDYLKKLRPTPDLFDQKIHPFSKPKDVTMENIIFGVQKFHEIATLSSQERVDVYGNSLLGIHDNESLATEWNNTSPIVIDPVELDAFVTGDWEKIDEKPYMALFYQGETPAQALDQLLAGPTVLDCGMFCQLSIWFGLRYVLGDTQFNDIMAHQPLFITQINYQKNDKVPYLGNPLYDFLIKTPELDPSMLYMDCIFNINEYKFKHPAGHYKQHNCIVINELYYIQERNKGLTKSELDEFLLTAYNQPPTDQDSIFIERTLYDESILEGIDHERDDWNWNSFSSEHDSLAYHEYNIEEFQQQNRRQSKEFFNGYFALDIKKILTYYENYLKKKEQSSATSHGMNRYTLMPPPIPSSKDHLDSSLKKRPREEVNLLSPRL